MPNSVKLKETLQKHWGHASFRPLQENIIKDVLKKKDTLAILPTGGGKSICYQLPAIILKGTCIVISPLIALINDQIHHLKKKGLEAITIPSKSSIDDIIRIFDNIRVKKIKFLYLSPERLSQQIVQEKLKQLNVSFIAVDEAHCISQWGHDFRPSYIKVGHIRSLLPTKNIVAVTATATLKTQEQIISLLKLTDVSKYIGSFSRPNLAYQIFETPNKFDLLFKILQKQKSTIIIYLQNRLAVQELNNRLNSNGLKSTYYHAGLSSKEKQTNFELWNSEQQNIMIATNAFGMGIDKSNVKLVIHLEIPNSLENYLQEAGRAGRDGNKSFSCVILSNNDFTKHQNRIQTHINPEIALHIYQKLNQHFQIALGEVLENVFDFDLDAFCKKYKTEKTVTEKTLRRLDSYKIIQFKDQPKNASYLQFTVSHHQLTQFSNTHSEYTALINHILRHYTGIFEIQKKLNIHQIASSTQLTIDRIHKKLNQLHQYELAIYEPKENNHTIQFLVPREDKQTINPIKKDLLQLCEIDIEKGKKNLAYFKNETLCRNQLILNYFNENNKNTCGICDICIANTNAKSLDLFSKQVCIVLKTKPHTFNDLLIALKTNSISLKKALVFLLKNNHIIQNQQFYQIK